MASTRNNQSTFISSLIRFIRKYGLDGVDLGRCSLPVLVILAEDKPRLGYPVADDRGGAAEDFENYVLLVSEMREVFNTANPGWEITVAIPSSYWYLRGFAIDELQEHADWFNVMTYNIHGVWDQDIVWTGPYLKGHTNLTEIEDGLDLLWRNGISRGKVVIGFGFYCRSFTMTDLTCITPPMCTFEGLGYPGDCTKEAGILSYDDMSKRESYCENISCANRYSLEAISRCKELGSKEYYNKASSVKWIVYGSNQWISFDDVKSFEQRKKYPFSRCLRGLMIWSLDLDTQDFQAMTELFCEEVMADAITDGSGLDPDDGNELAAYTGEDCYVTRECTDGTIHEKNANQVCKGGFSALETAHNPIQKNSNYGMHGQCRKGWWQTICCPTKRCLGTENGWVKLTVLGVAAVHNLN